MAGELADVVEGVPHVGSDVSVGLLVSLLDEETLWPNDYLMVLSGLVGLVVIFWLLGYEDRKQASGKRRRFIDWMREAWTGFNPAGGAMGVGWLIMGCLAFIPVGLTGLEN